MNWQNGLVRSVVGCVGLAILATLRNTLGSLDRVVRLIKVLGMVNAAPDFPNHPAVINGFSDLMVEVFGESGKGARSAVGMGSLPGNIAVEVEAIFEVKDAVSRRPAAAPRRKPARSTRKSKAIARRTPRKSSRRR